MKPINSKVLFYHGDGSGRDTYISNTSGGFMSCENFQGNPTNQFYSGLRKYEKVNNAFSKRNSVHTLTSRITALNNSTDKIGDQGQIKDIEQKGQEKGQYYLKGQQQSLNHSVSKDKILRNKSHERDYLVEGQNIITSRAQIHQLIVLSNQQKKLNTRLSKPKQPSPEREHGQTLDNSKSISPLRNQDKLYSTLSTNNKWQNQIYS